MKVKLHLENGDELEVTCYKTKSPHLVVNQTIHITRCRGQWSVTHLPTTWAILTYIDSKERAIDVANLLAEKVSGWGGVNENTTVQDRQVIFNQNVTTLQAIEAYAHGTGPRPS